MSDARMPAPDNFLVTLRNDFIAPDGDKYSVVWGPLVSIGGRTTIGNGAGAVTFADGEIVAAVNCPKRVRKAKPYVAI